MGITDEEKLNLNVMIYRRNHKKKGAQNINIALTGEPGTGKSYNALRICEEYYEDYLERPFPHENIVFDITGFLNRVRALGKCNNIIFDDSGLKYSSKRWFEELNQILGYTIQSYRFKIINVLFTCPYLSLIDSVGRNLIHARIESIKPSWAKIYQVTYADRMKKSYEKRIAICNFKEPKKDLVKYYEKEKRKFLDKEYRHYYNVAQKKERRHIPIDELLTDILNHPEDFKIKNRFNFALIMAKLNVSRDIAYQLLHLLVKEKEGLE
jgi:adenylate kinase family enzyme